MFEGLSERLGSVFDRLKKRGALSESDVSTAMREVRVALLEADVALPVVKSFIDRVRERAIGQEVIKSVTPGQMVVKIVHDELVATLGSDSQAVNLNAVAPVPILMVGLQGGGKTTTTAKLAKRLTERDRKKVLMASLDVTRPAAREQLRTLGEQVGVDTLPIVQGETALTIAKRAMTAGRLQGYDVVMLDTAGRTSIDEGLMAEARAVRDAVNPHEVLLVADALTGQDAVTTATNFDERVGITGIILTRVDGDSRGGAALSMRGVTGKPIKALGVGEKVGDLEDFHPERIAGRILGMGDVVSLVEKAAQTIEADEAEKMAERMMKGTFTLDDMASQLKQLRNLGGLGGVLGMLPGVGKLQKQLAGANIDDGQLKRQEAIISSMTKAERVNPRVMNASRKRRVAAGSGTEVQDINRLLKSHMEMAKMMKKVGKMGGKGMMKGLMGGGGGMPAPGEMPKLPSGGMGGGMGGSPGGGMGGMPGLGGPRLPGLPPGFPGKRK
ncbi:signal recognition particle protein [Thalassobaculum litoreum]|uniref:Signal recognition particle protein n=1 Tax=Thalassobaculum litoreum DSM 18839 TaxID=1123362 RepID=A0A8G2BHR1_9PROT|nr:signal recognition particle protein [Thalassobaculum litoreum]SDF77235.1 signal recognition particle subunit FFH/SRP54 (srp54) [Thalassobaculum litoreum DSM 18839]